MRFSAIVSAAALSTMTKKNAGGPSVVSMHWFRKGLRLHDNPALASALAKANHSGGEKGTGKFVAVYVLDGNCYQLKHCSPLRANFLIESLQDLDASLRELGSRLYVSSGDPVSVLPALWAKFGVTHLTFEEDETGEPYAFLRDESILRLCREREMHVETFRSETLFPLDAYAQKARSKVPGTMGAFQRVFGDMGPVPRPLEAPSKKDFGSLNNHHLSDWQDQMKPPNKPTELPWPRSQPKTKVTPLWNVKDCENLTPIVRGGESRALHQLKKHMANSLWVAAFEKPKTSCTALDKPSTTGISPYMSLGCLSPRMVWWSIAESIDRAPASATRSKPPVSLQGQMLWRDFNNLIAHDANTRSPESWGRMEGNPYCRQIPWSSDAHLLEAWKNGQTGYPWIDACMTQLRTQGWIHHLGRHAVACFLTRGDLWQSWEEGAAYFESQLLDADYALNGFNWLWLSCSGFFYQYFRCYSPVAFQKKNDPNGD